MNMNQMGESINRGPSKRPAEESPELSRINQETMDTWVGNLENVERKISALLRGLNSGDEKKRGLSKDLLDAAEKAETLNVEELARLVADRNELREKIEGRQRDLLN